VPVLQRDGTGLEGHDRSAEPALKVFDNQPETGLDLRQRPLTRARAAAGLGKHVVPVLPASQGTS
jgi:hypothetical protein